MIARMRGIIENNRNPTVSPHVGSFPSYMKLPINAQIEEINRVTGMNTEVAIITGRTKICNRNMCAYATAALTKVKMVRRGTVCRSVTYGKTVRGTFLSG